MERQEHMDYAAVVRDYHASGTKLSLSDWCRKEGYDYSKVKKYNQQKYILPELAPTGSAQTPGFINLEMVGEQSCTASQPELHIEDIRVVLSNGLELHLHARPIEDMTRIIHKILG